MKRRPSRRRKDSGAPKWMVTYSDMVTLILVFFILLFSMSQVDKQKFEELTLALRNHGILNFNSSTIPEETLDENGIVDVDNSLGDEEIELPHDNEDDENKSSDDIERDQSLEKLMIAVEQFLDKNDLNSVITAAKHEQGIELTLQESVLFDTAKAKILDSGKEYLNQIGDFLGKIPNNVKVEGHTDSRHISSFKFPSNWELSGARASSVIRYLIDEFDFRSDRFTAVGYGATRPLVPNTTPQNWRKNRRVTITILKMDKDD